MVLPTSRELGCALCVLALYLHCVRRDSGVKSWSCFIFGLCTLLLLFCSGVDSATAAGGFWNSILLPSYPFKRDLSTPLSLRARLAYERLEALARTFALTWNACQRTSLLAVQHASQLDSVPHVNKVSCSFNSLFGGVSRRICTAKAVRLLRFPYFCLCRKYRGLTPTTSVFSRAYLLALQRKGRIFPFARLFRRRCPSPARRCARG